MDKTLCEQCGNWCDTDSTGEPHNHTCYELPKSRDEKRRADSLAASLTRLRDMIAEATVIGPEPHKLIMEDGTVHTGPAVDFLHQLMELTVSYCDRALEKADKA